MLEQLQQHCRAELHDSWRLEARLIMLRPGKVEDLALSVANDQAAISLSQEIISSIEQGVATPSGAQMQRAKNSPWTRSPCCRSALLSFGEVRAPRDLLDFFIAWKEFVLL